MHALETKFFVIILRDKLQEGCYTVQWLKNSLRQSLRKVEPDSTSCNASCNKNVARLYDCEACYTLQFRLGLVSQW